MVQSFTGQHETISFIAKPATRKQRHTSITKRWKEHDVIILLLSQLYCLIMSRGFRFFKTKNSIKLTTLYMKHIVLIINK